MIDGNPPAATFAGDMVGAHPSVQSFSGTLDGRSMEILHDTMMSVQPQISEPLPIDSGTGLHESKFGGVKPSGNSSYMYYFNVQEKKNKKVKQL